MRLHIVCSSSHILTRFLSVTSGIGNFRVRTTREKAACLFLPDFASLEHVMQPCRPFYDYVEKHERSWRDYFQEMDVDYEEHGIVLVTGAVNTPSWGIAVMPGGLTDYRVSFNDHPGGTALTGTAFPYEMTTWNSGVMRRSQHPSDIQGLAQRPDRTYDHTVFLKYIKIKYRRKIISRHNLPRPGVVADAIPVRQRFHGQFYFILHNFSRTMILWTTCLTSYSKYIFN